MIDADREAEGIIRKDASDPTLKPGDFVFCRGRFTEVLVITRTAPGSHPDGCPVRKDWTAVEVKTEWGSRWHGISPEGERPAWGAPVRYDGYDLRPAQ